MGAAEMKHSQYTHILTRRCACCIASVLLRGGTSSCDAVLIAFLPTPPERPQPHLLTLPPLLLPCVCCCCCSLATKIGKKMQQLQKAELAVAVKEDLKTVALGTSKINYMDPRITIAWCKRNEVRTAGVVGWGQWCVFCSQEVACVLGVGPLCVQHRCNDGRVPGSS
jgi:hypothetical protein